MIEPKTPEKAKECFKEGTQILLLEWSESWKGARFKEITFESMMEILENEAGCYDDCGKYIIDEDWHAWTSICMLTEPEEIEKFKNIEMLYAIEKEDCCDETFYDLFDEIIKNKK